MSIYNIDNDWKTFFQEKSTKPYFNDLMQRVSDEYNAHTCFPPQEKIFNAFSMTNLSDVKVVILGQDPYHNDGQAQGLSFSVPNGYTIPPSLKNIAKELKSEYEYDCIDVVNKQGDLTGWAKQGVLLLNTTLTVQAHEPNSHSKIGWTTFTDDVIKELNNQEQSIVFLLWGAHAQSKAELITNPQHLVLQSAHPSPFSARKGFFGNNHFVEANDWLKKHGRDTINWNLLD